MLEVSSALTGQKNWPILVGKLIFFISDIVGDRNSVKKNTMCRDGS